MRLAAIWYWYSPSCILILISFIVDAILYLSIYLSIYAINVFNLVSINLTELSTTPTCSSLICFFDRRNIEGTKSLKLCSMFVYICFALCLCRDEFCGFDLRKDLYIYEKSFEM